MNKDDTKRKLDIFEIVTDEESALEHLQANEIMFMTAIRRPDIAIRITALIALETICDAWNKDDEFEPDLQDREQDKYYPIFMFIDGKLELIDAYPPIYLVDTHIALFCFKTAERAKMFGSQYIGLFRKAIPKK